MMIMDTRWVKKMKQEIGLWGGWKWARRTIWQSTCWLPCWYQNYDTKCWYQSDDTKTMISGCWSVATAAKRSYALDKEEEEHKAKDSWASRNHDSSFRPSAVQPVGRVQPVRLRMVMIMVVEVVRMMMVIMMKMMMMGLSSQCKHHYSFGIAMVIILLMRSNFARKIIRKHVTICSLICDYHLLYLHIIQDIDIWSQYY